MIKHRVINLMTGEMWEGEAENASKAYQHITIRKGDTTVLSRGRKLNLMTTKEWTKENK